MKRITSFLLAWLMLLAGPLACAGEEPTLPVPALEGGTPPDMPGMPDGERPGNPPDMSNMPGGTAVITDSAIDTDAAGGARVGSVSSWEERAVSF